MGGEWLRNYNWEWEKSVQHSFLESDPEGDYIHVFTDGHYKIVWVPDNANRSSNNYFWIAAYSADSFEMLMEFTQRSIRTVDAVRYMLWLEFDWAKSIWERRIPDWRHNENPWSKGREMRDGALASDVQAAVKGEGFIEVYFIQNTETGDVKIGVSNNPESRLKTLQTSSSGKLVLLATEEGGTYKEKMLHNIFGEHRKMGEWFKNGPHFVEYFTQLIARPKGAKVSQFPLPIPKERFAPDVLCSAKDEVCAS